MSEAHPTAPTDPVKGAKPSKPYPEFPLTAHPAGYWCKKIRGKLHYFGAWADPDGALAKYLAEKEALHAGRTPRAAAEEITVKELANAILIAKQALVDSGMAGLAASRAAAHYSGQLLSGRWSPRRPFSGSANQFARHGEPSVARKAVGVRARPSCAGLTDARAEGSPGYSSQLDQ